MNGRIKLYTATVTALFLLSPLLSLPYILWGIYKHHRSAFFFFALFLGFLAWLQVPLADLFRHSLNMYEAVGKPFSYVFRSGGYTDLFIPFIDWVIPKLGIPYEYFRLFYVTESFYLLTIIFNYMIDNSQRIYTNGEVFARFCIMYLFFEFIQTTSGVRYGFALCQYVYALHLVFNRNKYVLALLFALFALEIHESFFYFVPLSILLYAVCSTRKKAIILFVGLSFVLLPFISHFSYMLGRRADWYFGGGSSISDGGKITIYGFILFICIRIFLLPFVILVYKYFNNTYKENIIDCEKYDFRCKWIRMASVWIGLLILFITNNVMIFRLCFMLATLGVFVLLEIEEYHHLSQHFIKLIVWCGIITTLMNGINNRSIILNSRYQYIAMPVVVILQNHYDKQWVLDNINGNSMKQKF